MTVIGVALEGVPRREGSARQDPQQGLRDLTPGGRQVGTEFRFAGCTEQPNGPQAISPEEVLLSQTRAGLLAGWPGDRCP